MIQEFVHLKVHTEYSLLEGVGSIDEYIEKAKSLAMKTLTITDTSMFGVVEFYEKCVENGIKPIIGLEVFLDGLVLEGEFTLTLIAKNNIGYKNLSKLSSLSYSRYNVRRNKIKYTELIKHSEGLYILSGGMYSEISIGISEGYRYPEARKVADILQKEFKENFYIEISSTETLKKVRDYYFDMVQETGIDYVLTNDVYYVNKDDEILQKIVSLIKEGNKINYEQVENKPRDLYLKSLEEIKKNYEDVEQDKINIGIENTNIIAKTSNVTFDFDVFKFPKYDLPEGETEENFIKKQVYKGIITKYIDKEITNTLNEDEYKIYAKKNVSGDILNRVEYELEVINSMGYNGYFIIVWDFIKYAKENGIYVGPGRGSAAGSIVSYALDITEIDPIKYNLIFERFLNPERISMPDIDIDFDQEQREQVIDYVLDKYGMDHVAHIITFGTLRARLAIRDVGRVLNVELKKIDKVAKLIPFMSELKEAIEKVPTLKNIYQKDEEIKKVIDYSLKLEGKVRHASVHAAGIVISKDVLDNEIPTYSDGKTKILSTQYQMKELEDLGILKMDFLGLKNLTILRKTVETIKETQDKDIVLLDIPLDDTKTFELLTRAETLGVFQCESTGIRMLMQKMKIETFEDIIALLSLYRPGPLRSGMVDDYIIRKNKKINIEYPDESLKEILEETYGVILYQEQVLKIVNKMANYTLGEADELRRAMGKKIAEVMQENRVKFVTNSVENGYTKQRAEKVYDLIEKFGGYGFNKSHSAAYALIVYWTAYLKTNYPKEFFTAVMSTEMYNIDRLSLFINEARKSGINVLVPDINESKLDFSVEEKGIRFGLLAIKGIGASTVESVLEDREKGKYHNYQDFVYRLKKAGLTKKQLESLILSGGLDSLNGNRNEKYSSVDKIMTWSDKKIESENNLYLSIFGKKIEEMTDFFLDKMDEFDNVRLLNKEKEYLGVYVSDHPLNKYNDLMNIVEHIDISELERGRNRKKYRNVRIMGIMKNVNKFTSKKSMEPMAKFQLEEFTGVADCICFPRDFIECGHKIFDNNVVIIEGSIESEINRYTIIVREITLLDDLGDNEKLELNILIDEKSIDKTEEIKKIIMGNRGNSVVYFAKTIDNKKELIKLSDKYSIHLSRKMIEDLAKLLGDKKIKIR